MPFRDIVKTVEVGGQKARVLDSGPAGPVVVMLHGWGGRIESMAPVIIALRSDFRVVAFDLPGFGESPAPDGVWGTADYAEFVRDCLIDIEITSAMFLGHSFGGKTALYLAATHTGSVDKLLVTGASGIRTPPNLKARAKRAMSRTARAAGKAGPPGRVLRDVIYGRIASEDYKNAGPLQPTFVRVVNEDISAILPRVSCPTLLIWGTEDDASPLSHARRMEELIPDAGLVLFDGAGHFAYLDEQERFARVAAHFFGAK
ncbi:MAG TPA: alpha/beta hydrolase [Actinomycetota bacterium]|nr:alpha/beta hydrolase [Actinomycetota bacterium]